MQGRRVYPNSEGFLEGFGQPGDYGRDEIKLANKKGWWTLITPTGVWTSINPEVHSVTEHEDGTITVSPSILIKIKKTGETEWKDVWHGFLERGVWREA